jgi:hypothetical protein
MSKKLDDDIKRFSMSKEEVENLRKLDKNLKLVKEIPKISGKYLVAGNDIPRTLNKDEIRIFSDYYFKNKSKRRSRVTKSKRRSRATKSKRRSRATKSKRRSRATKSKRRSRSRPETKYEKFRKAEMKKPIYKDLTYREKIKTIAALWQIAKNKKTLKKRICKYFC